jgi:hypothetical protein
MQNQTICPSNCSYDLGNHFILEETLDLLQEQRHTVPSNVRHLI